MTREIILNFHGLGDIPPWVVADERPYWLPVQTFAEVVERVERRPEVRFTFDDGNRSDLDVAAPLLAKHGRTGTFFILTGRLDHTGYLTPGDIRSLIGMGMEIGLHGRDHVDWRGVDDGLLHEETEDARQTLALAAGRPVSAVSIPFGAYNRRVVRHLVRSGFSEIFTSDGGAASSSERIRSRTSIRADMSMETIEAIISGASPPAAAARRAVSTFLRRHII